MSVHSKHMLGHGVAQVSQQAWGVLMSQGHVTSLSEVQCPESSHRIIDVIGVV